MELFQNEAVCQTPLDRQYHTEVKALLRAKGRKNLRIFTYTDHDRYTNYHPFHQMVSLGFILGFIIHFVRNYCKELWTQKKRYYLVQFIYRTP